MQVYLPDKLYQAVKDKGLRASDLLQKAVRAELRRRELLDETDDYLSDLVAQVGVPGTAPTARAEALSRQVRRNATETRAL
ncbi:MAG: hypothetical protein ACRDX8_00890 [Acidimicrobiales bacterium]